MKHINTFKENYHLKAFAYGFVLAFIMFVPFIVLNGGKFIFYSDFNVQQIALYELVHSSILSGNISWSNVTDLGASFIGTYSSYILGSPFFWITLFFPTSTIQYLMGPLLIIKFACASLTASVYLKRYVKNKNYAVMGALAYAFSGFSIYNVFLGHYFEPIIIFPLLLAALDGYVIDKKRGLLAVAIFASCIVNYSFFVGQLLFLLLYFIVRTSVKSFNIRITEILAMFFEIFIGIALSMFLLLPSIYFIFQNDAIDNFINGINSLVYMDSVKYLEIIQSLFFPVDLTISNANFSISSLGAWIPLFGMTGAIAWIQQRRKHWLKKLLYILLACAFIPVLNSAFNLFSVNYSAMWFYILTLMIVLSTIMSFESKRVDYKRAIKYCTATTVALAVAIGFIPSVVEGDLVFGISENPERFWAYTAIALVSLAILSYIIRFVPRQKAYKVAFSMLTFICVLHGMYFIGLGINKLEFTGNIFMADFVTIEDFTISESIDDERVDFYSYEDNSGVFLDVSNVQTFSGTRSSSIEEYYSYVGIGTENETDVASNYAVSSLLSVRWLLDDASDTDYFGTSNYDSPLMLGFHYYGTENGFDIWENLYYIGMGFEYDSYVTESETLNLTYEQRQLLMIKTAIIPDEDEEIWAEYLPKYDIDSAIYSQDVYYYDCLVRESSVASSFEYTNTGFTATSSNDEDAMVFFSVPYDEGFTAYIDGVQTEIYVTNIGFMSIYVPADVESNIVFIYRTPGLYLGIAITVIAIVVLILYIKFKKKIFFVKAKDKNIIIHRRKYGKFEKYCKITGFKRGKYKIK